ncbi:histidine triad (HIT) family protein [Mariprofundus ferrinatatus]|uniref:Histidine triad (HIT) family protein n=1 Tax=Mariprofundus ferrinatatus TaxID=1921087 RepID=A0A2K8LBI4_9PROT|nr:histidine triad nucleotide-binding protein [Mariprofundus ferrinatatus]ATX81606.1 histidine triad (HIT) family protein [Mariprofundus ferrinatatus]
MSDCLFCKIAAGEIPCSMVYEDEDFLAFHDIHPKAPTHVLVIPKFHLASLADATEQDTALLGLMMDRVRHIAAAELKLDAGYRVILNVREGGGQEIDHIHAHILGGKKLPF